MTATGATWSDSIAKSMSSKIDKMLTAKMSPFGALGSAVGGALGSFGSSPTSHPSHYYGLSAQPIPQPYTAEPYKVTPNPFIDRSTGLNLDQESSEAFILALKARKTLAPIAIPKAPRVTPEKKEILKRQNDFLGETSWTRKR